MALVSKKVCTELTSTMRLTPLEVALENSTPSSMHSSLELQVIQPREYGDSSISTTGSIPMLDVKPELISMLTQVLPEVQQLDSSLIHSRSFSQECRLTRCTQNNAEETTEASLTVSPKLLKKEPSSEVPSQTDLRQLVSFPSPQVPMTG